MATHCPYSILSTGSVERVTEHGRLTIGLYARLKLAKQIHFRSIMLQTRCPPDKAVPISIYLRFTAR